MKNLLLILFFATAFSITAQTFEVEVLYESVRAGLNDEAVFPMHLINVSQTSVSLYIKRTENNIPDGWSSSLCFTYCFSPSVDSIATTRDYGSGPIEPGDTAEVSLHVFTSSASDSGTVVMEIGSLDNPDETQTFIFRTYAFPDDVEEEAFTAKEFKLMQNYPNPFNPTTVIKYTIPELYGVETLHATSLRIYNVLGEEIAALVNERQAPGNYAVEFNASDLPSGTYFYTLRFGNSVLTKKMILLK